MYPELFRIPFLDVPVYTYGLMLVIGFLAAMELAKFLARRSGLDPDIFVNAALLALVAGVVGARLSHVLENFGQYTDPTRSAWANFKDAINIRSGGLTYYGGFLLAFPVLIIYALKKKVPLRLGMDIVAPCLMVGLGFGRIGCFFNGCCYGEVCSLPWAVQFPYGSPAYEDESLNGQISVPGDLRVPLRDGSSRIISRTEISQGYLGQPDPNGLRQKIDPATLSEAQQQRSLPLQPAQLYSSFTAFLIAAIALAYLTMPHAPGRAFALMLILEGVTRYLLEMLRVEPPVLGSFSLSMLLGIGIAAMGAALWFAFGRSAEPRGFPVAPAASA